MGDLYSEECGTTFLRVVFLHPSNLKSLNILVLFLLPVPPSLSLLILFLIGGLLVLESERIPRAEYCSFSTRNRGCDRLSDWKKVLTKVAMKFSI